MNRLIVSDQEKVRNLLENEINQVKYLDLELMAKYFRHELHLKDAEIQEKLIDMFQLNEVICWKMISDAVKKSKKFTLRKEPQMIIITKAEMQKINTAPLEYRMLLFIMLVICKKEKQTLFKVDDDGIRSPEYYFKIDKNLKNCMRLAGLRVTAESAAHTGAWLRKNGRLECREKSIYYR